MRYFLFISIFFFSILVFSQSNFPKSWVGNYEGNLEIYTVDSIAMNIKMQLDILPTEKDSVFQWIIMYNIKDKKDIRSYELKIVDAKAGHYQIDEKNSIIIDAYFKNEIFTSFFKVNEIFILATYTMKEEGEIVFEIISAKTKAISTTGGEKFKEEEIPNVDSYLVNGRQRAFLKKKNSN